jgi:hypothetical protein
MRQAATMMALAALASAPACMVAQDSNAPKPPDHFYRLNLTVEQTSDAGQVTNTRSYVATIETDAGTQEIRTGSKVPVETGTANGNTQFQYIDVGVMFDVRNVKEVGDKLGFTLVTEVSSVAPGAKDTSGMNPAPGEPIIRSDKWNSGVLVPIGKPTVVFSADDLEDKGKMQVEVTATRLD